MKKIAVEKQLSNIKNYLSNEGYSVEEIDKNIKNTTSSFDKFDAVVLTGQSINMLGMEDTLTSTPTINAEGLTQEEVKRQIESKITRG
ncbi:YkuS family protein [Clostridium ganghwense]|uniref:YkuS family protein n=1 Tax=Clostridium ganghwense TaxID=312089 RepID=A0ABT4CJ63_9CLOT|nr:YkuS family protein [Clostridium ganghwense]MCY6369092.1 YkuS family protein [Clostridium ganghwense]